MKLLADTWLMYTYTMRATLRNPIFVIIGLFNPLCFLFLYAPLLRDLSQTSYFSGANTLAIFLPGLLIMMGMYATSYAGFKLIDEVRTGFLERVWVSPISRLAIILGRQLRDLTILLVQALLLIALAFAVGLEANMAGVALSLALVILVGTTLSACSYMLALLFKEEEALAASINFFLVPIQLLSGVTLPLTLAPYWLKTAARMNPLSHVVDGSRALFLGRFTDGAVIIGFALITVLAFISLYGLVRVYRSRAV